MLNSTHLQKLRENRLILPFYLPALILAFSQGMLIPIMPLYAKSFGVTYSWVGALLAAQGFGMLLSDVPSGLLLRRLGQRKTMLWGLGATTLATVALFWAQSIPEAIIYRLIAGFGGALYGVARHAYIAGTIATGSRGRAISLLGGMFRMGRFLGPLIGGVLASAYGLRMPFLVFGAACVLSLLVVAFFVPPSDPISENSHNGKKSGSHPLLTTIKSQYRLFVPASVGQIFAQTIRAGRTAIIPLYAADVIGLDVDAIGLLTTIAAGLEMTMFYPAGWVMDNLGRKWAVVPSFAIQAIAMACVPLTHTYAGLLLCTSIIGMANGLSSGSMMTLGADLAPPYLRGEFLGVWRLIGDVGGTGGPAIVGGVADLVTLPAAALSMAAAGLLAALVFGLLLPETLKRDT